MASDTEDAKSRCLAALKETSEMFVTKLFDIWKTVGYPSTQERTDVVCNSIKDLLQDMVEEEECSQNVYVVKVETLLKEAANLCEEIGGDYEAIIGGLEDSNLPLLEVIDILNNRMKDQREHKQQLLNRYEELLNKEMQLCSSIGLTKRPAFTRVPRENDLEDFFNYLEEKTAEERELRQLFQETKQKIARIASELEFVPQTSFHKLIASDQQICLSAQNMMMLKELHQSMEQQQERCRTYSIELREKLTNLWERLRVSYDERSVFLQQYPGHSQKSLDALKAEIQKCEETKRQNIRKFVDAIREEIVDWWSKCHFGKSQQMQFRSFYSDCYTEDLLELHEIEVERLKKFFQDNIEILGMIDEYEKLWAKMIELEERAHDPKRRFANRGGQLLLEEKERKMIQKQLPSIEHKLNKLLEEYESRTNTPFLYDGENMRNKIKAKWEDIEKKKEEEKLARKKAKDSTHVEKPSSAVKRKLVGNTPGHTNKVARTTPAASVAVPSGGSKGRRKMFDRRENLENVVFFRPKPQNVLLEEKQSPDATYSNFEMCLQERVAVQGSARSTAIPSSLLRERNIPASSTVSGVERNDGFPLSPLCKKTIANLPQFCTPEAPQ